MDLLILGLKTIASPQVLLWICLGVVMGVIFGALPGVSATMAIVLCISFTYSMDPVVAIAFLSAVYCAISAFRICSRLTMRSCDRLRYSERLKSRSCKSRL